MGKGALVFKGDTKPKKKKKKSKHSATDAEISQSTVPSPPASSTTTADHVAPPAVPQKQKGSGRITISGTVVTGHEGTRFLKQLRVGDALLLSNGEMRVVTMCLSNASVNVSSAFSQNFHTPTEFWYIAKPRRQTPGQEQATAQAAAQQEAEEAAAASSGTYGSNQELVYREKTANGSYRIVKQQLNQQNVTRGDLLEMRAKKKSDKYC
uniref:Uncharacterized protein n=1 Tax=Entomoneis paludosa TaxID=265537 RepID=A0A7S3DVF8_9STRA|mmetsp:Transcript_4160/g.8927  ORF Transcript_4160/g.8927 Transcript_4160/m.8927 type:complete len:209 (+) Transcript_4160:77-703(+)